MLGVLRCDWSELASLVGVAVTPVVGFLGNLSREQINPNPYEVRRPVLSRWPCEKYTTPGRSGPVRVRCGMVWSFGEALDRRLLTSSCLVGREKDVGDDNEDNGSRTGGVLSSFVFPRSPEFVCIVFCAVQRRAGLYQDVKMSRSLARPRGFAGRHHGRVDRTHFPVP